jgi:hypothetical protein
MTDPTVLPLQLLAPSLDFHHDYERKPGRFQHPNRHIPVVAPKPLSRTIELYPVNYLLPADDDECIGLSPLNELFQSAGNETSAELALDLKLLVDFLS